MLNDDVRNVDGPNPAPMALRRIPAAFPTDHLLRAGLTFGMLAVLVVAVALPLAEIVWRSLADQDGRFVGLANLATYLSQPSMRSSLSNSLFVAITSTVIAEVAAFGLAYGLTRTRMRGKAVVAALAMTPLFAPSLVYGIALVYLLGNKGLLTTGFFGIAERWTGLPFRLEVPLYGPVGIIVAETIWLFPQMVLILTAGLRLADARLYEAAQTLGGSAWRTFITVTLPGARYGLISAFFVGFTLVFTDFGIPKIVGGSYNVLATDIYRQVIGQQNFSMGATVSVLLLVPTAIAMVIYRLAERSGRVALGAGSVPFRPSPNPRTDALATAYGWLASGLVASVLATAFVASIINVWPYDLSLSLRHYDFSRVGGGGHDAYWNSVRMSLYTACFGTALAFGAAYLVAKGGGLRAARRALNALALVPLALPGLVVGLMYIFFFNRPVVTLPGLGFALVNPLHALYGTMALLVLANIAHFFTVAYLTATTALERLDDELETVAASLGAPFYRTFAGVTLPMSLPEFIEIAAFFFVSAMTTVSALIFLYPPALRLASVAVVNMDDAGDTAAAAAMSMLIVGTCLVARVLASAAGRRLRARTDAWMSR